MSAAPGGLTSRALSRRGLSWTAAAFLAVYALARLVAFGRETAIAYLFGASRDTDAYVAATAMPELVAGVLLSGVLGYAIIPELLRRRAGDDPQAAPRLVRAAFGQVLLLTGGLALVVIAAADPLTSAVAPGLDADQHDDAVLMLRVSSPAMVFYGVTGVAGAVLNTRKSFLPVPWSFVAGNALGIVVLIAFSTIGIVAAALGYVASAAVFALVQWVLVRRHAPIGRPAWRGPEVSTVIRAGLIAIVVTSAPFIRVFFERILASTASAGDLAALGFATRLIVMIGAVVAVSVGTVVFPTFAEQAIAKQREALAHTLRRAVTLVVAVSLPISVAMAAAPSPIVGLLFEHGEFTASDTAVTSEIVRAFAFGLVAICVSEILLRALFALGAHRRALVAVLATLALNFALDVWLLSSVGVEGLGIGASVALWVNVAVLGVIVARTMQAPAPGGAMA
jgi:putative peptidoglycan lipid II flippase